jgi:hypothetical protein
VTTSVQHVGLKEDIGFLKMYRQYSSVYIIMYVQYYFVITNRRRIGMNEFETWFWRTFRRRALIMGLWYSCRFGLLCVFVAILSFTVGYLQ